MKTLEYKTVGQTIHVLIGGLLWDVMPRNETADAIAMGLSSTPADINLGCLYGVCKNDAARILRGEIQPPKIAAGK